MIDTFEIVPYIGAKPLLFEMSENEIKRLLGEPLISSEGVQLKGPNLRYKNCRLSLSRDRRSLVEISIAPSAMVSLGDLTLFNDNSREVLRSVISLDPNFARVAHRRFLGREYGKLAASRRPVWTISL